MQRLIDGAQALGLHLTEAQQAAFQLYYEELVAWNEKFNLTAITEYEQVQIRHFLDSLSCLQVRGDPVRPRASPTPASSTSAPGPAFPGIPLKIVCPGMRLTLLEATGKKVTFLEHIVAQLDLQGVTPVQGRAEELAHDPDHREQYDLALARAVAESARTGRISHCLFARSAAGGCPERGVGCSRSLERRGGHIPAGWRAAPGHGPGTPGSTRGSLSGGHRKIEPHAAKYPRRTGIPSKRPLGQIGGRGPHLHA